MCLDIHTSSYNIMAKVENGKLTAPRSQPSGLERVRSLHRRFSARNK
jgi:hypothetical protein